MRATRRPLHLIDIVYYSVHIEVWEAVYRPVATATVSVKGDICDSIQDQLLGPVSNTINLLLSSLSPSYFHEDSDG